MNGGSPGLIEFQFKIIYYYKVSKIHQRNNRVPAISLANKMLQNFFNFYSIVNNTFNSNLDNGIWTLSEIWTNEVFLKISLVAAINLEIKWQGYLNSAHLIVRCSNPLWFFLNLALSPCEQSEVANLTERKIRISPYMVSKSLSVCQSVCYKHWPKLISGLAKQNGLNNVLGHLWQKPMPQRILFVRKVSDRAGAEGRNSNIFDPIFFRPLYHVCLLKKWWNGFILTVFLGWSQIFNTIITTQTWTIRRGYKICHTNFTTT